jgi:predicted transposase/invertase (TIGR01784 family)
MYVAPLNIDRFFKKVFSDPNIAKAFLQDFLGVIIESIEPLQTEHKITSDSTAMEFDYRCKINDQYVIIDMQQWYKPDVVKRFYLYHTMNTSLQSELVPVKSLKVDENTKRDTKNYDELMPVVTVIWFADDSLRFKEDYIAFTMLPEIVALFVRNPELIDKCEFDTPLQRVLNALDNKHKSLDFLPKNRMIYAFQKNIVKNQNSKKYKKYFAWFDFAEKSKNKENTKADFVEYEKDPLFAAIIQKIGQEAMKQDDYQYIEDFEKYRKQFEAHDATISRQARQEGRQEEKIETVKNLKKLNVDFDTIAKATGLSVEEIEKL